MKTALRTALEDLRIRHGNAGRRTDQSHVERAASKLPDDVGALRPPKDYDAISARLASLLKSGGKLKPRQARDGAWCLWGTEQEIAGDPATLEPFLKQLRELKHRGASRALALSYLIDFHEDRPGLSAVAAALRDLAHVAGRPFEDLAARFRIFEVENGPKQVAEAAFQSRSSPRNVLESHGLQMELVLSGGFVEPCTRRVLELVAKDHRFPPMDRLDFVELLSLRPDTWRLAYPNHKVLVANALLLSFENSDPDKLFRDKTLNFLTSIDGIGDPRTHSGNWVNMPRARDVAISWLTEQALRQFLDVVEEVNPNENWHYRRRFWEAMHDNDAIKAAWVVLDGEGTREARRRFGKDTRFAGFQSGGVQVGHAVLLLRIGNGVCAEWSFNGKCRFWTDYNRDGAPQLYKPRYDAEFLRSGRKYPPVLEITHMPHTGPNAWQHKAARQIAKMTGLRFSAKEYLG
tara:strand:+ start:17897 stop:19279 length:1383 start_codon:yes stop_codon:yes gene_type:complete